MTVWIIAESILIFFTFSVVFGFSTLSTQRSRDNQDEERREVEQKKEKLVENICGEDVQRLEGMLQAEREERSKLGLEKEKLRQEKETLEEQRKQEEG